VVLAMLVGMCAQSLLQASQSGGLWSEEAGLLAQSMCKRDESGTVNAGHLTAGMRGKDALDGLYARIM
jgi:hypothetical protein